MENIEPPVIPTSGDQLINHVSASRKFFIPLPLIFLIIIILTLLFVIGILSISDKPTIKTTDLTNQNISALDNKPQTGNGLISKVTGILESKPEGIVVSFFQAVKNKDKIKAKSFLSPDVNKDAFQSTFEDTSNTPSLYTQEFSYNVTGSTTDISGNKSFVNINIDITGQTLPTKITLDKNDTQLWQITDSETVIYGDGNLPFEKQTQQTQMLHRVLLLLSGPAQIYITSPEGTHTGYDPNTKTQVNEIKDVSYSQAGEPKSLSVTDLIGTWELKVIGTGSGKYTLYTELIDNENHQTDQIEGTAIMGSINSYTIRYPTQTGKPLEVIQVK